MIVEGICNMIFGVVDFLIGLLPSFGGLPSWLQDFIDLIGYALNFVPRDVWIAFIGSLILWKFGLIAWSIIEWIYKKLPGVS